MRLGYVLQSCGLASAGCAAAYDRWELSSACIKEVSVFLHALQLLCCCCSAVAAARLLLLLLCCWGSAAAALLLLGRCCCAAVAAMLLLLSWL